MSPKAAPNRRKSRPTLKDVAAIAGVDPSAVSRVVNQDRRISISEETRARILAAVEELGYQPNLAAKGLRMSRTWTLGLVLPEIDSPTYQQIVQGVRRQAAHRSYGVVLGSHATDGAQAATFEIMLEQGRVDGLLVASGSLSDAHIRDFSGASGEAAPIVLVNRTVSGVANSVVVDDASGSFTATRLLLEAGHRRIAGLFGPETVDTSQRRHEGFQQALADAGVVGDTIHTPDYGMQSAYERTLHLLGQSRRPTAIYASTVLAAFGVMRAVRELALSIPSDLSVIALHDTPILNYVQPGISTVTLPMTQMGAEAVDLVLRLIDGGPSQRIMVEGSGTYIDRGSVAPC